MTHDTDVGGRAAAKERTHRALLDAAAHEFAALGYGGAGIERIAARAGVTTGALYAHFGSKAGLFLALYDWTAERTVQEVTGALRDEGTGAGPVAAARAWLSRHAADPRPFILALEIVLRSGQWPDLRRDLQERRAADRRLLAGLIREDASARVGGTPVADAAADEAALVLRALANGLLIEHLAAAEDGPLADPRTASGLLGRWVDVVLDALTREEPCAPDPVPDHSPDPSSPAPAPGHGTDSPPSPSP